VLGANLRDGAVLGGRALFAGSDDERLDAFHELIADESIAAVVFARGGHGVLRLLDRIDWSLVERRPKPFVGYSDLTPLLLALVERTGTVAFHGPMIVDFARGLLPEERKSLLDALAGRRPRPWQLEAVWPGLSAGRLRAVRGPLLGGCLTMLAAALGTSFQPDLRDAVLVLEDLDEPEYRIDRMLTQLRVSRCTAGVRAIVAGHFTNCEAGDSLIDLARTLDVPLFAGLPAGHGVPNHALPRGAPVRLDPAAGILEVVG